jgi:hypothetical protein
MVEEAGKEKTDNGPHGGERLDIKAIFITVIFGRPLVCGLGLTSNSLNQNVPATMMTFHLPIFGQCEERAP